MIVRKVFRNFSYAEEVIIIGLLNNYIGVTRDEIRRIQIVHPLMSKDVDDEKVRVYLVTKM